MRGSPEVKDFIRQVDVLPDAEKAAALLVKVKTLRGLNGSSLINDPVWLTRAGNWVDDGLEITNLGGYVRLKDPTRAVKEIGKVDASGRFFPTYFNSRWYPYTGYTAVGTPKNGCQVYKGPDGKRIVKREPDLTGHDMAYVNQYLTGHER